MTDRTRVASSPRSAAVFWASVLCLPFASIVVVTVLAHALPSAELPSISLVFGLSLVGTVIPIGVQARAAADTATRGQSGTIALVPAVVATAALAAISVPVALVLDVGIPAVVLPSLSLGPAMAVAAVRGDLIGRGAFGAAARNNSVEALVRVMAGIGLGLLWGANGVGASLLLCTLGAWLAAPRRSPSTDRLRLPSTLAASATLILSVNWAVIVSPRLLGDGASAFTAAALPAMGVYMAMSASAWIVVPHVRDHSSFRAVVRPVGLVVAAGCALAVLLLPAAPVIGRLLDRPTPELGLLAVLGLAMALASGSWVLLQLRLVRSASRPWLPSTLALFTTALVSGTFHSSDGLAAAMVLGQLAGLVTGLALLAFEVRTTPVPHPPVPAIARVQLALEARP